MAVEQKEREAQRIRLRSDRRFYVGVTSFGLTAGAILNVRQVDETTGNALVDFGDGLIDWIDGRTVRECFDNVDETPVESDDARPFAAWLDKNCDLKRHHVGPVPLPELGGKPYECDYWHFVVDDQDDGETPAIAFKVDHEERSGYMGVQIENYHENGTVEATCFVGLFKSVEDLETVLKIVSRVNR